MNEIPNNESQESNSQDFARRWNAMKEADKLALAKVILNKLKNMKDSRSLQDRICSLEAKYNEYGDAAAQVMMTVLRISHSSELQNREA